MSASRPGRDRDPRPTRPGDAADAYPNVARLKAAATTAEDRYQSARRESLDTFTVESLNETAMRAIEAYVDAHADALRDIARRQS